jgi:asparagine synthase (glutamine-hydrolysing)
MCGIVGFYASSSDNNLDIIKNMLLTLEHRGPDDNGYIVNKIKSKDLILGHTRLSIQDLTINGHQPMHYEHLSMVYNGEVYNFIEIKLELKKNGYIFDSSSDTEVILKAFHKWGLEAINKFNGMFAIILFDCRINKLYLFRDRAGVKPLYYYHHNNLFLFSSELKSFHKHDGFQKDIDKKSLNLYFQYGYVPSPFSIFKNTFKVESGSFIEYDLENNSLIKKKYWDILKIVENTSLSKNENELIENIENTMLSSFKYRMISDRPVGIFLSGGNDSSMVAALLAKNYKKQIKTFTLGFKESKYNEAPYAKDVADYLKTEHYEYYCTYQDAIDIVQELPKVCDEPFADSSVIPTMLLSKFAKEHVDVVLSADGGDEIFGGYGRYITNINQYKILTKLPKNILKIFSLSSGNKLKDIANNPSFLNIILTRLNSLAYFGKDELVDGGIHNMENIFDVSSGDFVDKLMKIDYLTYLEGDILQKVDRASMYVSLESREPMLDYRLVELLGSISSNKKIKNNIPKYLLKQILYKHFPKKMVDRKKMGFSIPLGEWLSNELSYLVNQYLTRERFLKYGLVEYDKVEIIIKNPIKNPHRVWSLLMFQMWCEEWL